MNIEPISVAPSKWGPLFWSLLNTIALYSNKIPQNMSQALRNLVSAIPYVLPCKDCENHCHEIYSRLNLGNMASLSNFKSWVWTLKSEVNKNTGSINISYDEYLHKLKTGNASILKKQVLDLFAMISLSYPHNNDGGDQSKRRAIYKFIYNISLLFNHIPYLKSLSGFTPSAIWNNKIEFQNWLKSKSWYIYKYPISFDGSHA
jgi:hypothetical protein